MGYIREIPEGLPIREMATAVIHMVTDSIDSFVKQDGKLSRNVIEYDDVVDDYFNSIKHSLVQRLKTQEGSSEAPATAEIPVILATAKGTEFDKVIGLDLGADDYLAKPFGMMEMVSRVKAVLRRVSHTAPSQVLTHKNITLNESSHQVFVDGNKIELTIKEYQLLRLFLKNPGVAFTRENLLSSVWESEFQGETRTVDVHIASLRMKLGSAGEAIKTVRGVGYRLEEEK